MSDPKKERVANASRTDPGVRSIALPSSNIGEDVVCTTRNWRHSLKKSAGTFATALMRTNEDPSPKAARRRAVNSPLAEREGFQGRKITDVSGCLATRYGELVKDEREEIGHRFFCLFGS